MEKPTIPKGTRDFGPSQMAKRQLIFDTIRGVFQKFGFQPLETPSMENLTTLTGKYGEEGDQLLFKILNSGDYLKDVSPEHFAKPNVKAWTPLLSEKGLRYDLTVPFARYVVMNRHEITFPFKRYQIQPVWRADRPQKGRYREFFQCDADVVGTHSLICEAEIIAMINEIFTSLNIIDFTIKVNHRDILSGLAEITQASDRESSLFVAMDKLDKIGAEKVKEELRSKGFSENSLTLLFTLLDLNGSADAKMKVLSSNFNAAKKGKKGIADLEQIFQVVKDLGNDNAPVEFDVSLARGLSYYTGTIFEVKINNVAIGSVSGGGRYDNLTGVFGMPDVSGVGISFGVDRIYDAMEELGLFPKETGVSSKVLITYMDDASQRFGLTILQALRKKGIASEIYPDNTKLKKQLEYANRKMIPVVVVIGSEEVASAQLTVKFMDSGEQKKLSIDQLLAHNF